MKYLIDDFTSFDNVAPLVGAWIEIADADISCQDFLVAPLVGAWIEILIGDIVRDLLGVAPLVGAWIEILSFTLSLLS